MAAGRAKGWVENVTLAGIPLPNQRGQKAKPGRRRRRGLYPPPSSCLLLTAQSARGSFEILLKSAAPVRGRGFPSAQR